MTYFKKMWHRLVKKREYVKLARYKRFVSYMYRYVHGEKRDNSGYARIENYEQESKITIHLKDVGKQDKEAKVYLFHRNNEKLEGIYLDKILFHNGIGEFQVAIKNKNVVKSSYEFSEISGIIIYMTSQCFWATEWDGQPIQIRQFSLDDVEEELEEEEKKIQKRN